MKSRLIMVGLLAISIFSSAVNATLIGDNIHATAFNEILNTNIIDEFALVTDPGVEFSVTTGLSSASFIFEADFNANSVTLSERFFSPGTGFTGGFAVTEWTFTDLDWIGQSGTIIDVVSAAPNGATIISIGTNFFSIRLPEVELLPQESISYTFDIITTHTDVPEPSTLAIFALGMMGLASRRLKKKS